MTQIIIEFEASRDQIQSVYNFSVHKGLRAIHNTTFCDATRHAICDSCDKKLPVASCRKTPVAEVEESSTFATCDTRHTQMEYSFDPGCTCSARA